MINNEEYNESSAECAAEELCEDSTEMLLKKYDRQRSQKTDDIFAVQTVLCVLIAAAFFAANLFYPELCSSVFDRLKTLISDEKEIIPNPIDYFLSR